MRINEINTIKLNSSKNVRTTKLYFKEKNINILWIFFFMKCKYI